jgi:hypothetical protein
VILFAGVTVNFLFAWFVFTMLFWRGLSPIQMVSENASTTTINSYLTPTISFLVDKGFISDTYVGNVIINSVVT